MKLLLKFVKQIFCKHKVTIWLRPWEQPTGVIYYPAKVCQSCHKCLAWCYVSGRIYSYIKPQKLKELE